MSFYWNILSVLGCSLISWIQQWKCSDLFQEYLDYFLYSQGEYLQLSGLFSAFSGEYLQLSGWFSIFSRWIFTIIRMIFYLLSVNIYSCLDDFLLSQDEYLQYLDFSTYSRWIFTIIWMMFYLPNIYRSGIQHTYKEQISLSFNFTHG